MRGTRTITKARSALIALLLLGLAAALVTGCTPPAESSGGMDAPASEAQQASNTPMEGMESDADSQGCSACTTGEEPAPAAGTSEVVDGAQVVTVGIVEGYYTPNQFTVKSDMPVKAVFKVEGKPAKACVSKPTFKSLNKTVTVTEGEAAIDLGMLEPGTYEFSCGMGANVGTVTVE